MRSTRPWIHGRRDRTRADERGQAMVEFAIIAPLFIMLVAGIIQFGVALNFWLDMQRIANQGARWAAVDCGPTGSPCTPTLWQNLEAEPISGGLNPQVEVCYPEKTGVPGPIPAVGDPVTVELEKTMALVPLLGWGSIDLRASATMRLEQKPTGNGASPSALEEHIVDAEGECTT